jgi:flagellar basal body-associated protein FliL
MKLSELKKQIKDNIYEILSEESVTDLVLQFNQLILAREIEDKIKKILSF